ncbi:hypothetical protein WME98_31090 [Sorangium sp. So ce296]|uniref:RHS repeat domain-containing protein n=1 Tax=Sorangium sp. So ce296 TaxID=3133296 RepID=UPI003F6260E1
MDSAGRYREEASRNGAVTERSYYADKQRLKSVVTRSGATAVQDLGYGYDERLSLTRHTDALQPRHRNERFRYDALERLTCAYFSDVESATAPCALRYDHDPNGNLTFAPDAGTLSYDDPLHPHAVIGAGADSFGYDALGEHIARRSVPVREDTPERERLYDRYEYDAVGREVRHTTAWNAVTATEYDGWRVRVVDPLDHMTVTEQDPLGRTASITDAADGITRYSYGPFGMPHTVTDPGGAVTRTTRDAFGRVRQLDDPDRGTTVSIHDGFGELVSSTDALGRESTWTYDALGRPRTRVDRDGAERVTTTWTWDTAAHGIGKLHALASPDAEKTYGYTDRGQLDTLSLRIDGERAPLEARLGYDELGRVEAVTYPAPAGAAPFVVDHDHDAHGHGIAVRDRATGSAYWRLTDVDDAGRFQEEVFGNGVITERSYFADKQRLRHMVTRSGAGEVQDLDYGFDDLLNLTRRTDALQAENTTERFRYDPLQRLTCAYFGDIERASAPCALRYGHDPNGNLTFKSDIGTLSYDDPLHPHAVTGAGADNFTYDAVGNQIARPGGTTVHYTPFDLPERITQGASTITFGYDGDQQRIRKTTPEKETLYFGDLYERVTDRASGTVEHRYHVHSPERVVAIVTRGGSDAGTRYVHVDHLGSVDALTDEDGDVIERRSYDPFGQRRNPVWGETAPASSARSCARDAALQPNRNDARQGEGRRPCRNDLHRRRRVLPLPSRSRPAAERER